MRGPKQDAPLKKKYLRANESPFMTKQLRKMIMNRSRCKNGYLKNKTVENWEKYRKLRNECVKLTNKVKKEYYHNINIKSINDNKKFWKTIKPNFANKNKTQKIILVEDGIIVSENNKTAEIFNNYFINIVKDLNIPDINSVKIPENVSSLNMDRIDKIIEHYNQHPSVVQIRKHVPHDKIFSFEKATESQIETEIKELNSNKAPGADGIPANILKESIGVIKHPLMQLYNVSIDKLYFPHDLK